MLAHLRKTRLELRRRDLCRGTGTGGVSEKKGSGLSVFGQCAGVWHNRGPAAQPKRWHGGRCSATKEMAWRQMQRNQMSSLWLRCIYRHGIWRWIRQGCIYLHIIWRWIRQGCIYPHVIWRWIRQGLHHLFKWRRTGVRHNREDFLDDRPSEVPRLGQHAAHLRAGWISAILLERVTPPGPRAVQHETPSEPGGSARCYWKGLLHPGRGLLRAVGLSCF